MENFVNTISYEYLWDLFSIEKGILYKKMKQKYGFSFSSLEEQEFTHQVLDELEKKSMWQEAKTLIVPQTSNQFLLHFLEKVNKEVYFLKKKSKSDILHELEAQDMMKTERVKLYAAIEAMKDVKMANIAGNQRKRFISLLFNELDSSITEGLFFDDSVFSGYTFLAAQEKIHFTHQNLVLFSKH
jgi:pyruvate formate-lyase activating enzyme-like uncharacterized protein